MMSILVGIIAGLHRASYGAYKDAPYEGFYLGRFLRELIIAAIISLFFWIFNIGEGEHLLIIFLVIFAISMMITEIWKMFIRYKDERMYRIPVRIHIKGKAVESHALRLVLALGYILFVYGVYRLGIALPASMSINIKGIIIGFLITLGEGIGGGYKDGWVEGFKVIAFLRSPILGILGGLTMSLMTNSLAFILLGTIAFIRILIEVRKFFKKGYMPGKFKQGKVVYPKWLKKRKAFLIPYIFTGIILLLLIILVLFNIN